MICHKALKWALAEIIKGGVDQLAYALIVEVTINEL